jgi:hypothetical protein
MTLDEKLVLLLRSKSRTLPPYARLPPWELATIIPSIPQIKLCIFFMILSFSKNIQERLWLCEKKENTCSSACIKKKKQNKET